MRNIREVLRLSTAGVSSRKVAASLSIGASTVIKCLQRARQVGPMWPLENVIHMAAWG
jgi:transposase